MKTTKNDIKKYARMFFKMAADDKAKWWNKIVQHGEVGKDLAKVRGYRIFELSHRAVDGKNPITFHVEIRVGSDCRR